MERVITSYIPNKINNPYSKNVRRLIEQQGYAILPIKKCLIDPTIFRRCKVINFNWYDKASSYPEYLVKRMFIDFLHLTGKKIIYTLHNKQPHNQSKNKYSKMLMRYMCIKADAIVGLCPETKQVVSNLDEESLKKIHILLHPNYISNYNLADSETYRGRYGISDGDMVFLFLGIISPYKNIELLLKVFNKIDNNRIKLIIAGNPADSDYLKKIKELINGNANVITDFRYIPDEEVARYYNTADVVILPYHKSSSLNSGAVYLSFSLGKTIVCPDIGTIKGLLDHSFVYDYEYENENEHFVQLEKAIFSVCKDFEDNPEIIQEKGRKAYKYISEIHADEIISSMYGDLYGELLDNE